MSTVQINMHEAKSKLSYLGELVWQGNKVVIAKAGKPYLDLVPHKVSQKLRKAGKYKNEVQITDDFFSTSDEIADLFEGK